MISRGLDGIRPAPPFAEWDVSMSREIHDVKPNRSSRRISVWRWLRLLDHDALEARGINLLCIRLSGDSRYCWPVPVWRPGRTVAGSGCHGTPSGRYTAAGLWLECLPLALVLAVVSGNRSVERVPQQTHAAFTSGQDAELWRGASSWPFSDPPWNPSCAGSGPACFGRGRPRVRRLARRVDLIYVLLEARARRGGCSAGRLCRAGSRFGDAADAGCPARPSLCQGSCGLI